MCECPRWSTTMAFSLGTMVPLIDTVTPDGGGTADEASDEASGDGKPASGTTWVVPPPPPPVPALPPVPAALPPVPWLMGTKPGPSGWLTPQAASPGRNTSQNFRDKDPPPPIIV